MSLAGVLLVVMFGQAVSAEDVISQMRAQDDQIETLEFLFRLETVRGPGYYDDHAKVERTETNGRLWFRAPHEVKLERLSNTGVVLDAHVVSPDGTQVRGFSTATETGNTSGFITTADFGVYMSGPFNGVAHLFRHAMLDNFREMIQLTKSYGDKHSQWRVTTVRKLLHLTFPGRNWEWKIDPTRGYCVVADSVTNGNVHRTGAYDPVELLPGIWMTKSAKQEQTRGGKVFMAMTATLDVDSVKINQPLGANAFDLIFPSGTLVENMLNNTAEFVGGRNSRDRKSVEQLAVSNNAQVPVAPVKDEFAPEASALRVPETSFWGIGYYLCVASVSLLVLGGGWFSWKRWWRS